MPAKPRRLGQCKEIDRDRYRIKVYLGTDSTGQRHWHTETFCGKRKAAEERLREIHNRHRSGEALKASNDTFNAFLDEWMTAKKLSVAESTIESYSRAVDTYIRPHIGKLMLSRVDAGEIQNLYVALHESGLARSSISYMHTILNMVFKLAVLRKKIASSPMVGVQIPRAWRLKEDDEKVKAMTADQVGVFMEAAAGQKFELAFYLAFKTGFRPGELLGLKWRDLDAAKATLKVQRTIVYRRNGGWYLKDPKTKLSRRTLPLTADLVERLTAHRKQQLERRIRAGKFWQDHDFIFCNEIGEPFSQRQLSRQCKEILKSAGLPEYFNPYSARHTSATLLLADGANVKAVSERLGHSKIAITLGTYSHVLPGMQEELSERIDALLNLKK